MGVTFKLICALAGAGRGQEMLEQYADLVALGTVADVMPLVGENRIIVAAGLRRMAGTHNVGLSHAAARVRPAGQKAHGLDHQLYPSAGASMPRGRLGHADMAAELFLTDDPHRAQILAALPV